MIGVTEPSTHTFVGIADCSQVFILTGAASSSAIVGMTIITPVHHLVSRVVARAHSTKLSHSDPGDAGTSLRKLCVVQVLPPSIVLIFVIRAQVFAVYGALFRARCLQVARVGTSTAPSLIELRVEILACRGSVALPIRVVEELVSAQSTAMYALLVRR